MSRISTSVARLVLVMAALAVCGFAQMRGGIPGGMSGTGSSATTGMSGLGGGMGVMANGPAVGPDGTAYVLRQTSTIGMMGSQSSTKTELVAINPSNGKVNWALQVDGTMISTPVLAKDGTILLTTSEPEMMTGGTATAAPALLIIAPTATSARIQARVTIDSDLLSLPVVTPDGQTIYVMGTDMPDAPIRGMTASTGTTYLYAFFPGTGNLKFKVQLR
jgi:outer membrane protein assembly factor BamB